MISVCILIMYRYSKRQPDYLYLLEGHFLMFDQVNITLNSREEYFNACPHKRKYLLLKG